MACCEFVAMMLTSAHTFVCACACTILVSHMRQCTHENVYVFVCAFAQICMCVDKHAYVQKRAYAS